MASASKIIEQKIDRLTGVPDKFVSIVDKSEAKILKNVLKLIAKLDRDTEGLILPNEKNFALVSEISTGMKNAILDKEYVQALKGFAGEFDKQAILSNEYFLEILPSFTPKALYNNAKDIAKRRAITLLTDSGLDANVVEPINNLMNSAVSSSSSFADLVAQLSEELISGDEKLSRLSRYSRQISYDSFAISDANYTKIVADDVGMEFYFYQGDPIKDTRDFCQKRSNEYFHKKEVEQWGNIGSWGGRNPSTNPGTIFSLRGGYNCRHILVPLLADDVPKDVVQRNIDSGNYTPDN